MKYDRLISKARTNRNAFEVLQVIAEAYPLVLSQIGYYNSAMRFVQDNKTKARILGKKLKTLTHERDKTATLIYKIIEPQITKCVMRLGGKNNFDGDLLRYMTLDELKEYLASRRLTKQKLLMLRKRRVSYVYVYYGNRDYIYSSGLLFTNIYKAFVAKQQAGVHIIKGTSAYPGKVSGRVYKSFHGLKKAKPGYNILVTNITRPQDNIYLKNFSAIITDEGGILSHISVVARELKIPCVMSTKIASSTFKTGDFVEVDATKGLVRRL